MASTTLVNTADAAELRLVHFLGDHDATSPFILSCENAITQADATTLIQTVASHKPAIDKIISDEEGVGAFSLLAALLDRIEDATLAQEVMKGLVLAIESNDVVVHDEKVNVVESKLSVLCALYNLRAGAEKCWILGKILSLAAFSGDEASVMSLLPERHTTLGQLLEGNNLETLLIGFEQDGNGLKDDDKRALYLIASSVVGKVVEVCIEKDMGKEAAAAKSAKQRFLLKMLSTYSSVVSAMLIFFMCRVKRKHLWCTISSLVHCYAELLHL